MRHITSPIDYPNPNPYSIAMTMPRRQLGSKLYSSTFYERVKLFYRYLGSSLELAALGITNKHVVEPYYYICKYLRYKMYDFEVNKCRCLDIF